LSHSSCTIESAAVKRLRNEVLERRQARFSGLTLAARILLYAASLELPAGPPPNWTARLWRDGTQAAERLVAQVGGKRALDAVHRAASDPTFRNLVDVEARLGELLPADQGAALQEVA